MTTPGDGKVKSPQWNETHGLWLAMCVAWILQGLGSFLGGMFAQRFAV